VSPDETDSSADLGVIGGTTGFEIYFTGIDDNVRALVQKYNGRAISSMVPGTHKFYIPYTDDLKNHGGDYDDLQLDLRLIATKRPPVQVREPFSAIRLDSDAFRRATGMKSSSDIELRSLGPNIQIAVYPRYMDIFRKGLCNVYHYRIYFTVCNTEKKSIFYQNKTVGRHRNVLPSCQLRVGHWVLPHDFLIPIGVPTPVSQVSSYTRLLFGNSFRALQIRKEIDDMAINPIPTDERTKITQSVLASKILLSKYGDQKLREALADYFQTMHDFAVKDFESSPGLGLHQKL